MNVKLKKLHPDAVVPVYSRSGDCGLDFTAVSVTETEMYIEYGTGIAISVPENYVGLIYPRSSLSNYDLILANSVGVIDQNFTGEIKFRFKKAYREWGSCEGVVYAVQRGFKKYEIGNRIGQIILHEIPKVTFVEVSELDETVRGDAGYGSSGV